MERGVPVMGMSRNVVPDRHVFGFGRIGLEAELTKQQPSAEHRHVHDHVQTIAEPTHS